MPYDRIRDIASGFRRLRGAAATRAAAPGAARAGLFEAMESRVLFAGTGLAATYFDDPDFGGVTTQRVDPSINFNWQGGAPAPDIEPDTYSVRWAGQILPRHSEQYTFHTTSNDGVRLWVDGQLLVDNWTNHVATENSGQITLSAGRKYAVRLNRRGKYRLFCGLHPVAMTQRIVVR